MLINRLCPGELYTATVDNPLNGSRAFAWTLASILSYEEGRSFQINSPHDDWSQMILDLLCTSATASFNRRRAGHVSAKRWKGDMAFSYILHQDEPNKKTLDLLKFHDVQNEDAYSGLSVICVDLGMSTNSHYEQR